MNIGISGLGLIGGSLAAAMRKYIDDACVIGYDANPEASKRAEERGLVNGIKNTFDDLVNSVDILFLAATASSILEQINVLKSCGKRILVTDVCSVKRKIISETRKLPENVIFTGGHPMAGSQKTGNEHADPDLFVGAVYVLSSNGETEIPGALKRIISEIGARILILPAEIHDSAVSKISHIPQLNAVALLNLLDNNTEIGETSVRLAAGGFRDMTRIGESAFSVWRDIIDMNRDNIIRDIAELVNRLNQYKKYLENADFEEIEGDFIKAREVRNNLDPGG